MQDQSTQNQDLAAIDTTPLPLRNDTILGVCEAIGRDFGFNPNWLRVILGASVLASPAGAFAAYAALAVVVGLAHLLFGDRRVPTPATAAGDSSTLQTNDDGEQLPIAA